MLDLKREIENLRKRLATMEQLDAIQSDPVTAAFAREVFGGDAKSPPTGTTRTSLVERIKDWFKANKRESATLDDMAAGVGVTKAAVRQVVYTRSKERFSKTGVNDSRESLFKLIE